MATKKKTKKKQTKSKTMKAAKKKLAKKRVTPGKKLAKSLELLGFRGGPML
jgi:hypothetical protein